MCVFQKTVGEINADTDAATSSVNDAKITLEKLQFGVKLSELKDLMQLKSIEAKQRIEANYTSVDGLAKRLCTNLQSGIGESKAELDKRVEVFGKNEIPKKKAKNLFQLAFDAVQDTTLIMLIICAVVSIGLSFYHPDETVFDEEYLPGYNSASNSNLEWVEGAAIMVAVIVVVFVTAFNDWRKERQFRGLQDQIEQDNMASVIRNGLIKQVGVKEILVGDLCLVKYGDLIPADGILTQASDLNIDESSLTGETDLIKKDPLNNLTVLSGNIFDKNKFRSYEFVRFEKITF